VGGPEVALGGEPGDAFGEVLGVHGADAPVGGWDGSAAVFANQGGEAAGHGLEGDEAKGIRYGGEDEEVVGLVEGAEIGFGVGREDADSGIGLRKQGLHEGIDGAGEGEVVIDAGLADGVEEEGDAFAEGDGAGEEEAERRMRRGEMGGREVESGEWGVGSGGTLNFEL
jgi:hypothetical protein